jgi:HSP20 family protein
MDFGKLAPWNWFKKEEEEGGKVVPVKHGSKKTDLPASIYDLHTEFNRLFDSLKHGFGTGWPGTSLLQTDWFKPSLDVASDEKEYSIKVELPGIDPTNISLEYSSDTLKIKGEKRQEKEEKDKDFYRIERSYGSFQRILDIPEDADADNITSNYKDGVLSITIPRKQLPKKETKKIEIKTES